MISVGDEVAVSPLSGLFTSSIIKPGACVVCVVPLHWRKFMPFFFSRVGSGTPHGPSMCGSLVLRSYGAVGRVTGVFVSDGFVELEEVHY